MRKCTLSKAGEPSTRTNFAIAIGSSDAYAAAIVSEDLICPFCGERFEGEELCPVHDLPLVSEDERQAMKSGAEPDPRDTRPWIFASSILGLIAFFLPFFRDAQGELPSKSALTIALTGGESLWLGFFAPMAIVATLLSRQSLEAVHRVRLALALVALLELLVTGLAAYRGLAFSAGGHSTLAPGLGLYLLLGAALIAIAASLALGRPKRR